MTAANDNATLCAACAGEGNVNGALCGACYGNGHTERERTSASSAAFGEALAAELPALLGRANAIAPNRVQNGSQRGEDPGCGSRRRQLAVVAVRKLASLWSRGKRRACVSWWLYFVRAGAEERARWETGKPGAYARRVLLLTLDRGERVELLSHKSGADAAAGRAAGIGLTRGAEVEFDDAPEVDSGGAWLSELVDEADRAAKELAEDERIAAALREQRKAARKERAA